MLEASFLGSISIGGSVWIAGWAACKAGLLALSLRAPVVLMLTTLLLVLSWGALLLLVLSRSAPVG